METSGVRVLEPAAGVLAFYDGRLDGHRYGAEPNWVDAGAISLGTASFAIVDGGEALVYDTHVSVAHGELIRWTLEERGVEEITVLLSHWHLDHVAGTEAFADREVIASARTAEHLRAKRRAIEAGELEGPPAIDPLVLPTRTFEERLTLEIGAIELELIHVDIHSDDAAVVWMPERRLLLAGDTVEDTVTYVGEPGHFDEHLRGLDRLLALEPERVLPNHGDPGVIAAGGYGPGLLRATQAYIRLLRQLPQASGLRDAPLRELLAPWLESGDLRWFEPYERVHRENMETILKPTDD